MSLYSAKELAEWELHKKVKGGFWVPARPDNYKFDSWKARIFQAWNVLLGRFDAVIWEDE